jgi:predicted 3-demethylubiquinone-9 3-methyltransferase (glyoxalase superfamily)
MLDDLMRDGDPAKAKKATDAMLKMIKLDIAELQKAARS